MAPALIGEIDWAAPWLAPWRALGQPLAEAHGAGQALPEVLNRAARAAGLACRFQTQSASHGAAAYERAVHEGLGVPTRENLHDFFNGLCWLQFPQAKQRLNRLHVEALQARAEGPPPSAGGPAGRGPVRDALTVFDENAALLQAPEPLWQALAQRRWAELFGPLRPLWAEARLRLFGHALLEQLVRPYKSITAHVWRVPSALGDWGMEEGLARLDAWLAEDLQPARLAAKPFAPLPVLGVPGWWAPNQAPGFYDDAWVFRPLRAPGG